MESSLKTIGQSSCGLGHARSEYKWTGDVTQLLQHYETWIDRSAYVILKDEDANVYKCFKGAKGGDSFYASKTLSLG